MNRYRNFKQDILAVCAGEPIEAISVGPSRSTREEEPDTPVGDKGPISWDEAAPHLDYQYDAGYGGQDCHDVYIWTASRVFYVHEYDGSTRLEYVPRNPPAKELSA